MWRNIAANALTLLIVGLVVLIGVVGWAKQSYEAKGPLERAICLRVESGSNFRTVSQQLAQQGAVSHAWLMRVGADYAGKSGSLKAGSFLIAEGSSMAQIVEEVTGRGQSTCGTEVIYRIGVNRAEMQVRELDTETNRFAEVVAFDPSSEPVPEEYTKVRAAGDTRYRVSMAEGATVWQVVTALKSADFLSGEIKDMPAEGTLAPESYEVTAGADRSELVGRMVELQAARLAQAWQNRDENLPVTTPTQALVLASLIEKETGVAEERRRVASVFVNRLRDGIRLQTDPAVIYGVTGGQGVLGRGLRQSELKKDTPYNTYLHEGLPPTPIANPGLASIEAALHPEETDFVYFVADGTGGHVFSRTLAEHNANVAKWRAIEQQQQQQQQQGDQSGN